MSRTYIVSWLTALAVALATGLPASAQDLETMQLFAPANMSTYGSGSSANEGYFFTFDWIGWSIPAPTTAEIGAPGVSRIVYPNLNNWFMDHNTHDTSMFSGQFKHGQRVEVGRVGEGRWGWFVSTYRLDTANQTETANNMHMLFEEDGLSMLGWAAQYLGGTGSSSIYELEEQELPVMFDEVTLRNKVTTFSVELNGLRRFRPFHNNGNLELFMGVRYMQFDNSFDIDARGVDRFNYLNGPGGEGGDGTIAIEVRSALADSGWHTEAHNRIIGPQIGGRWFKKRNRWTTSVEGRFFAGYNQQRIRQNGYLGSHLDDGTPFTEFEAPTEEDPEYLPGVPYTPIEVHKSAFEHRAYANEWSPGVEMRLELSYQVTRSLSVNLGWTGFWIDGIAWATRMNQYLLADDQLMGILMDNNRNSIFTHGFNVGVEFNR